MNVDPKYRPPQEERWVDGMRTAPVRIHVRTEWLYGERDPEVIRRDGRTRWAFSRSGHVTSSDVPSSVPHMQDIASHLERAVAAFGDDKDLIIEVRLSTPEIATLEQLRAIPVGTVVLSAAGTIACRYDQDHGVVFGDERPFPWEALHKEFPLQVLYPSEGKANAQDRSDENV